MKQISQYTDEEKREFTEAFYSLWDSSTMGPPDKDAQSPWGAPWIWAGDFEIDPDLTVEQAARLIFSLVEEEIIMHYQDSCLLENS